MKFETQDSSNTNIESISTDCLVLTTSSLYQLKIPKITLNYIKKLIQQEELELDSNLNKSLLLFNVPGILAKRLLLISTGSKNYKLSEFQFLALIKAVYSNLHKHNISDINFLLTNLQVTNQKFTWQIYQLIINLQNNLYTFEQYKSKKSKSNNLNASLNKINFIVNHKDLHAAQETLNYALAVTKSCKLTKDLANTPPNVCTTTFMAKAAQNLSKTSSNIKLTILEKKDLEKLNMGAFLSVAQGSPQPPKLICLEYKGKPATKTKQNNPIVFIGKGVVFDTGGNSLKPANSMIGMKYDMSGAATVLGLINFAVEMKLNINIVGIMAVAENMPGGNASRPEDVVTTMSGLTVEILNTDAEGRLLLCEALTYCKKFNPKVVIDIATLTGACAAALGNHYSGLFSNNQELSNQLIKAGTASFDKVWQFPITEEYHKQLDSNIADMANIGGSTAGAITAACFLEKFATKYNWAHLDIAGTATVVEGKFHYATGRPIPLLAEYLMNSKNLI